MMKSVALIHVVFSIQEGELPSLHNKNNRLKLRTRMLATTIELVPIISTLVTLIQETFLNKLHKYWIGILFQFITHFNTNLRRYSIQIIFANLLLGWLFFDSWINLFIVSLSVKAVSYLHWWKSLKIAVKIIYFLLSNKNMLILAYSIKIKSQNTP